MIRPSLFFWFAVLPQTILQTCKPDGQPMESVWRGWRLRGVLRGKLGVRNPSLHGSRFFSGAGEQKKHKIDTQNGRKKSCDKRQTTNFQPSFSAIYRLTLDETMLCWPYVRLYWTYLGPPLPVCCPRSALCEPYVDPMLAHVGPMLA